LKLRDSSQAGTTPASTREFIEQDMVAVRVSPDHRPAIVGSARYFESHPRPRQPRDLLQHRCINFRHGRDEKWCQPFPGFFLYYPSRRQRPAALSAVIDALRLEHPRK
jgi:hypothetical protein